MMRLKKTLVLIWLCSVLVSVEGIFAQGPPPFDRPGHWKQRERIRENIETLRMWKLLEVLDLTSEQSTQFLPALKDFQDAKRRFEDKRRELLKELEVTLESEKGEKKLKEALVGLENARREFQTELAEFIEKRKATLTLKQQAILYLFEEKFERKLRETIQHIRGKGQH